MKKISPDISQKNIRKTSASDAYLRFSFKYFDNEDEEVCPPKFHENYTQTLMERLKALSAWTIKEFMNCHSNKSVRIHQVRWEETSRPKGFGHLNQQLRDCPAWQFQLSKSEHGRVHGFFLDDTFHVVWLDKNHKVYA